MNHLYLSKHRLPVSIYLSALLFASWMFTAAWPFSAGDVYAQTQANATSPAVTAPVALFDFAGQDVVESLLKTQMAGEKLAGLKSADTNRESDFSFLPGDILPVSVNPGFFTPSLQTGDTFIIPLPDGGEALFRVTGVNEFVTGHLSFRAVNVDDPMHQAALTWSRGGLSGSIDHYTRTELFHIVPVPEELHRTIQDAHPPAQDLHLLRFRIPEEEDILECGTGQWLNHERDGSSGVLYDHQHPRFHKSSNAPDRSHETSRLQHNVKSQSHLFSPFDIQADTPGKVPIDLLIVYTANAANWAENSLDILNIETVVTQMMNLSQQALDNSGVDVELRIVHMYQTDYVEIGDSSAKDLQRLTASPQFNPFGDEFDGYMEEVHTLRDQYGADLVSLIGELSDVGGMAWMLSSTSGSPHYGFSINRVQQMWNSYTFIHEVGHNMGNHHSRNQQGAPAGIFGGIFDYSTGWRFTDDDSLSMATVMTYAEGSTRIPYFSNPDITYNGVPTGSYGGDYAPADNVRSMRYTRHLISNYRPSQIDPPVVVTDLTPIDLQGAPGRERGIRTTLSNTGDSPLHWTADIRYSDMQPKPAYRTDFSGNYVTTSSLPTPVVIETGFEASDGFTAGSHVIAQEWVPFPRNDQLTFEISTESPGDGSQHLRLRPNPSFQQNQYMGAALPFTGPLTHQGHVVGMDLRFSQKESDNSFHVYIQEMTTDNHGIIAWVYFDDGRIIVRDRNENQEIAWYIANGEWREGQYYRFEIHFLPRHQQILYYLDDVEIYSADLYGGTAPERMMLLHLNHHTGETFDVDNLLIKAVRDPEFPRFQLQKTSGAIAPGHDEEIRLGVIADDIPEGVYEFDLHIATNDTEHSAITIPVRYEVTSTYTSADDYARPRSIALEQNYPNPFNPVTHIYFSLPEQDKVTLEVYSISGQRVATLVNGVLDAGDHSATFDASGLASGIYLYHLNTGNQGSITRRLTLIK